MGDINHNRIRKITVDSVVTTFAGGSTAAFADGTGTAARFNRPFGVATDASGNLYVAEWSNHRIRKITPERVVTTFAGSGTYGSADGTGTAASFGGPSGVAVDALGNVYVADYGNHRIRKITAEGVVTTLAGSGTNGSADGTGTAASFNQPSAVAVDASSNVYVADYGNHRIRKITAAGVVTTLAGSGTASFADGTGTAAGFRYPAGIVVDASGNLYVGDQHNHCIRKITPAGVVTTLAGYGGGSGGFGNGTGRAAYFHYPSGVALDASGNLYVGDEANNRIRKISLAGYSIAPALPTGLSIDPTTGVISGTPTVTRASTTYTVTAANTIGSSTTTVTFSVVSCDCDPTCSPIPTSAGTYTATTSRTDAGTGVTHYCDGSGNLLLSTKPVTANATTTIPPAAVQVKVGTTAATFYPKWCGGTTAADKCFMVKTPATGGNVLINRFWHIDAAQVTGTAVNATNQLQISTYFSDAEFTALQTQMSTNSVVPALTSQTGLILYQPFASPVLAKFADPSLVKPLTFTRIGNGASVGVNLWLHTTPTSGINAATFKVNSIVNSGGIGRY